MERHRLAAAEPAGVTEDAPARSVLREEQSADGHRRFFIPESASIPFASIDAEHHQLADSLNRIWEVGERHAFSAAVLTPMLARFGETIRDHFAHEEAAMESIGFPQLPVHRGHHRAFLTNIETIISAITQDATSGEGDIRELFTQIIDDALRDDLHFKTYLDGRGLI